MEHRAAVEQITGQAAAQGLSLHTHLPPPVVDDQPEAPWLEARDRKQRNALDRVLRELGWRATTSRIARAAGRPARYERGGLTLWVGQPALSRPRITRRARLSVPLLSLAVQFASRRKYEMEFAGLRLNVPVGVFRPHPSTTRLVSAAHTLPAAPPERVYDVGTGSGAIALKLALAWPSSQVIGIDRSAMAVATARANARRHHCRNVRFRLGDLLEHTPPRDAQLIIGNLAWLAPAVYVAFGGADRQYRGPPAALLDDHADGMGSFRRLIAQARSVLVPGGSIVLQLSTLQRDATLQLLQDAGFRASVLDEDIVAGQLLP